MVIIPYLLCEPGERIDLARLEETDLPADARGLFVHLLSPGPEERPKSAKAVKRWLEVAQESR